MVLTARVDDAVGRAVQELAADDNRTVSNYLEILIKRHVVEKGRVEAKPKRGQK